MVFIGLLAVAMVTVVAVAGASGTSAVAFSTPRVAAPEHPKFGEGEEAPRIPGHYIVVFNDSVEHPANLAEAQIQEEGGDLGFIYRYGLKGYSAELSKKAVEALREDPRVDYVAPDRKLEVESQTVPVGIKRVGATENAISDIDGKDDARVNVDVAVIDTGIDYTHPDLNVYKRVNCVPPGENWQTESEVKNCVEGSGTDGKGHGTHVAGTIGAIDNGEGVVGVAPGARLWAVRVLSNSGGGSESWIVAGVDWVTAHASEIEVANMSLGAWDTPQPALEASINASVEAGVVYVVAAGNESNDANFESPAKNPNVITVSALADYDGQLGSKAQPLLNGGKEICQKTDQLYNFGEDDTLAWFSNYGSAVDVAAPGVCVLSTWPGGKYAYDSGTSMASPHVAGAAALLASQSNPNSKKDVEAIRQQIVDSGNQSWVDVYSTWTSPLNSLSLKHTERAVDNTQEPLLDVAPAATATYTTKASEIALTEAKLNGGANPFGVGTSYQFEYGTTTSYGSKLPSSPKNFGSANKDVKLTEIAKGLQPDTVYHYRLKTVNESTKKETLGEDRVFKTPPSAITEPATSMTTHGARLSASIDPIGVETSYQFEYGLTSGYGQIIPVSPKLVGSGNSFTSVGEFVGSLRSNTTYHFRVVATNKEGVHYYGKDETFKTASGQFVAGWPEPSGIVPESYPAILTGKIPATISFQAWDNNLPFNLFECKPPFALTGELSGNAESMSTSIEEAQCEAWYLSERSPLKSNGCRFEFFPGNGTLSEPGLEVPMYGYDGTMDIAGPTCTGITISISNCLFTLPPQRGIDVSYWSVFDSPHIEATLGNYDIKYTLAGSGCPGEGSFEDGTFLNGVWTFTAKYYEGQTLEPHIDENVATTGSPTELEATGATLSGTVDAYGREGEARIQYGTTMVNEHLSSGVKLPASFESKSVGIPVGELLPSTTYRYRLYVQNEFGYFYGDEETFTTPSAVRVSAPTLVSSNGATLNGIVNPMGIGTTYQFEYGLSKSYGTSVPIPAKSIGSGTKDVKVSEVIGGLSRNTLYHYRLKTESSKGVVTYTGDEIFETSSFQTERAPATITGKQEETGKSLYAKVALAGTSLTCKQHSFTSGLETIGEPTMKVVPSFGECTFFGQTATVEMRGCALALHPSGTVDVAGTKCAAEPMRISIPSPSCTVTIGPQTSLSKVGYAPFSTNPYFGSARRLAVGLELSGITYTATGAGCEKEVGTFSNGRFTGLLESVRAVDAKGLEEGVWVEGEAFHVERAPATITGKQEETGKSLYAKVALAGTSLTCKQHSFTSGLETIGEPTMKVVPSFGECTFFGQTATVEMRGCALALHPSGTVDVAGTKCAAEPMRVSIPSPSCTVTIGPQTNLSKVGYAPFSSTITGPGRRLAVGLELSGITYTATGAGCEKEVGTFSNGRFTGLLASVRAVDAKGLEEGVWVEN